MKLETTESAFFYRALRRGPILRGEARYVQHCQSCHGIRGVGETRTRANRGEIPAPALDDTAHAWHHGDEQLAQLILNGSSRDPRMVPWKGTLDADQVGDLVAYIKSLWSARSMRCQGPKHMSCM